MIGRVHLLDMEDQSLEWEIVNYSSSLEDEETEKTRLGWLLNTALCLGKNLVITGVVISSVPLVLPPLVVISVLGYACSVPFGVLFASYACSQKLLSKLMPSPRARPRMIVWPYEDEEVVSNAVEEKEKELKEAAKDEIEMRIELVDKDDTRDLKQSLASTDERGYFDGGECSGEKDDESFVNHVDVGGLNKEARKQHSSSETSKDVEKPCSVDHAVVNAVDRKSEGHENTSSLVKDVKLTLPILQDQTDNLEAEEGEQNVTNNKERENFLEEAENEELEKTLIGIAWSGQSGTVGGADINIEEHTVMVHNEPGEIYNRSRMIADEGEHSLEVAVLTDMPEDIPGELKKADDARKVYGDLHSDEGLCEEKIWKKIDGMRAIVGFKAPRHSSYFEELKALYLFTGIEPPCSSTDPSDLTEFYNKLCFLMSVIGLK